MAIEKARIGDSIYDVVTRDEYERNPAAYSPKFTAIKFGDGNVYPVRNPTDNRPGYYDLNGFSFVKQAPASETNVYSQQNIISFSDKENIREIINAQKQLNDEERAILTTIDSLFVPDIGPNDTPETKALKQAVCEKGIDLDKYERRFGPNYNNDKRLFKRSSITLGKMKQIMEALDMKCTMIIEDANPDVPNPIGHPIYACLTGDNSYMDDESTEME